MQRFFRWIDELADLPCENTRALWLGRAAFVFLLLMTLAAPHSIAATQTAWLLGMLAWTGRLLSAPRPRFRFGLLDYALCGFFAWSVISSIFSYAPDISVGKLRGASLFLIFYFVYYNLRTVRAARVLAVALIASAMVVAVWAPLHRLLGRGVEVRGVAAESPLRRGRLITGTPIQDGDTIIQVGRKKIGSPEALLTELERGEIAEVIYYRPDYNSIVEVRRADLLDGETALEQLGVQNWKKSHVWRSAGFYGHYTTFAEVLQLVASLALGLLVGLFARGRLSAGAALQARPAVFLFAALGVCLAVMSTALLLTVTRASQLALLISAAAIVWLGGTRKLTLTLAAVVLPLALIGLILLQQSRQVGFFDRQDASISWRQTVYREGLELWTASPRNFVLGVGMDSIKRHAGDWRLFDDGRLPMGHFHSTPLQLAVERGLPALVFWFLVVGVYARLLRKRILDFRSQTSSMNQPSQIPHRGSAAWLDYGILLGCFGGLIGFFTSGLVHYNLGDGEVAMVFYLLMGLGVFVAHAAE